MRLSDFWRQARDELRAGRSVSVTVVADQRKGTPGTRAARMLLTEKGEQYGTIGGGIMEKRELEKAGALLASDGEEGPQLFHLRHSAGEDGNASGLICGGGQTNLRFILKPDRDWELVERIVREVEAETGGVVRIDPKGLALEKKEGRQRPKEAVSLEGGQTDDWRVWMDLRNRRRIAIFGGGHCGSALARMMDRLEYAVTVIEPRGKVLGGAELPSSVVRVESEFEDGAAAVRFPEETLAVVMTYSMPTDVEALAGALRVGFEGSGVMGSGPKIARIQAALAEKGFSDLQIGSVRAPIGLPFNSDTPEEIAVSVAAQILLEREESTNG